MTISAKELRTLAKIIKDAVNTENAEITVFITTKYESTEKIKVYAEYENGYQESVECPTMTE